MSVTKVNPNHLYLAIQYLKRQSRNPDAFFNLGLFLENNDTNILNQGAYKILRNAGTDPHVQLDANNPWRRVFELTQIWDQSRLIQKYHARLQHEINQSHPDYQKIYQFSSKVHRLTSDQILKQFVYDNDNPDLEMPMKNTAIMEKFEKLKMILKFEI